VCAVFAIASPGVAWRNIPVEKITRALDLGGVAAAEFNSRTAVMPSKRKRSEKKRETSNTTQRSGVGWLSFAQSKKWRWLRIGLK